MDRQEQLATMYINLRELKLGIEKQMKELAEQMLTGTTVVGNQRVVVRGPTSCKRVNVKMLRNYVTQSIIDMCSTTYTTNKTVRVEVVKPKKPARK